MSDKLKFDHARVADLARQIAEQEKEIEKLIVTARKATDAQRSAENRLANLRIEFTKAAQAHLDRHSLPPEWKAVGTAPA